MRRRPTMGEILVRTEEEKGAQYANDRATRSSLITRRRKRKIIQLMEQRMTLLNRGDNCAAPGKIRRSARAAAISWAALLIGAGAQCAHAAPIIKAGSEAPNDGPIKYTVTMDSEAFGHERATRTIRSGQSDDFTWQDAASGGQQPVPDSCPGASNIPRSGDGSTVRQIQVRLTPVIESSGNANVQIMFQGYAPRSTHTVTVAGKELQCPVGVSHSEVLRFSMPTATGSNKTVALGEGSKLTVSVSRK